MFAPNSTVKLPQPEQIIGGKYRLRQRLGQGGMGYVFEAEKLHLGTKVAVKFLDPEPNADSTRLKRFLQEARVAVEVNHPGAAQLLDAGHDELTGSLFLVFEYVDGKDVREALNDEGRLAFDEARDVCIQVAEVLAFAHARGIVHRDVKPENVRMRRDLGGVRVKVLDFGIARLVNQGAVRLTAEGMLAGTPRYMAPEQIRDLPLDARTDVYALGLMFFEMLTGTPAFNGKNLSQVLLLQMNEPVPSLKAVDVSLGHEGLDAFLRRACAKQPLERFQNMEEFVAALKGLHVTAWPSPRRQLTPGQDAPTAPQRPQMVPTADAHQPAGERAPERTAMNPAQRDATLFVNEESARAKRPDAHQQKAAPASALEVPWNDEDPSRAPTSPSRPSVSRESVAQARRGDSKPGAAPDNGIETLRDAGPHTPIVGAHGTAVAAAHDPSIESTWREPPSAKPAPSRWWLWFLLAGLLAAAIAGGLWVSGVFPRPQRVGQLMHRSPVS
ncbi:MAG: protein kinase [Myxococcaceae bacterium]|nr:protein kinase [Myxococcaceae bacterium]